MRHIVETRRGTRTRTVIALASMINNHDKVILIIIGINETILAIKEH